MRSVMIGAAALAATGSDALALSCMRPDPVGAYADVREAEERFRVVYGTFTVNPTLRAQPIDGDERGSAQMMHLSGLSLGRKGLDAPYEEDVLLRMLCTADWCGGPPGPQAVLAFVELHPDGPRVTTNACGGGYYHVTADELKSVVACHRGGRCATATDG